MKGQVILLALVASLASYGGAEPSCPPSGDTVSYFPHSTDCSKFLTCHWGSLVELSCPSGTLWNDGIKACDLQGNVVCSLQPEPTTSEPTTEPATAEPTTAEPFTTTTELATTTSTTAAPSTNPSGQCPDTYDPNHQVYLSHADCTKYYICTWGGVAVEQSCPPNLHWNQNLSYCDYPEQAGCSSTSPAPQPTSEPVTTTTTSSPAPSTSAPSTTSPSGPSGNCPTVDDLNNQIYFPHPTDCSKFLTCHWGSLVELSCPDGTLWNDAIKACDLKGNVVCSLQPEPTTTEPTTTEPTTTEPTTTEPATAEPTTAAPTTAEPTTAEPTTLEPFTTTTELATTTSTTAAPPTNPSGQCPDTYDPNHQVYLPNADYTKYYICTWGGVAVEQNCPPNLHWNQNLSYCDYPEQAGCSSASPAPQPTSEPATSTTSASTDTSPAQTTTSSPPAPSDDCPAVYDPNHQVYFPHADCTKYYICTYEGNKLEQNCPAGLHWNQILSYCDFPEQAGCSPVNPTPQPTSEPVTTTPTSSPVPSTPATSTTSPSVPSDKCPNVDDPNHQIYFPHPTDCSKFLTCVWGNLIELSCPSGTFWNDAIKACDLQGNVVCSLQPEPTTAEPTTAEPTTSEPFTTTTELATTTSTTAAPSTNPSGKCPDTYDPNHQVYLPHADCTKYYICTWGGVAVEQNCPPNLHWNQNLSYCDYPEQAGCSSASPAPQPTSEPVTSTPALATTAPPSPSGDCPPVYDPNHQVYFPHADCTKYYICTYEGNKLEQNCPAGLHWSQAQSYCDHPEIAHCTPLK